jgi:hypothetical protein
MCTQVTCLKEGGCRDARTIETAVKKYLKLDTTAKARGSLISLDLMC